MTLWTLVNITYNRKVIDRGVILARRKYKSELARTQKPCQLFDGDFRISFQTPHKRDLIVFAPEAELAAGKVLTWLHYHDETDSTRETVLKIQDVSKHHASYEIVSEQDRHFPRRRFRRFGDKVGAAAFGMIDNPFLLRDTTRKRPETPDLIVWETRTFRKRSNFCFVYQPERKKYTGTAFKQVYPEEIHEEVFRFDFETYDILTGRKLDNWLPDVRQAHFTQGLRPAPTWREV